MAPLLSLYIATTLDGFIARANGSIDWLTNIDEHNTDYGYARFYDSVDGVVMGSKTFELIQSFGTWPYPDKPTFVFTHRPLQTTLKNVFFTSGNPETLFTMPEFSTYKKLWLTGGSKLIASCQKANIITEYILTILPVVLGNGLRLFTSPVQEQWLTMVDCKRYNGGVLQVCYKKAP